VALALDLGLRGVSSVVVESRTTLANIPKGQGLTQRTLEHFYFWGLDRELRAARTMPPGYPIGEITAYGSLASQYWQAPAGREVVGDYFFPEARAPAANTAWRRCCGVNWRHWNVDLRVGVTATAVCAIGRGGARHGHQRTWQSRNTRSRLSGRLRRRPFDGA